MMMYIYVLLFLYCYFCGGLSFCSVFKNILCMLISLEFMSLSLFMLLYLYMEYMNGEYFFLLYYLVFCVCEGVLGLSLLVSMVRFYGNDVFSSMNLLKC